MHGIVDLYKEKLLRLFVLIVFTKVPPEMP